MFKKLIDGKSVIVKANSKNIPPLKVIKDTYAKIPDNKRIPIVFETKEQYLDEYIKNQEKAKRTKFPESQKNQYKHQELQNMHNIVSRYTTDHNPYIDRRIVFFNDHKIPTKQFHDSALHEYGHELWEKNPKIRKDWKSVARSSSPTSYGATSKQEDFAESYMLAKTGRLQDPKRESILSDAVAQNRVKVIPWHNNIEQATIKNADYRHVIFTGGRAQLVLMSLKPKQSIGNEVHPKVDQFFRIEQGKALFKLDNGKDKYVQGPNGATMVPAGTWHNVTNASANIPLKLYTIYSPPNHPPGTIQHDRPSRDKQIYLGKRKQYLAYTDTNRPNKTYLGGLQRIQDSPEGVQAISTVIGQSELLRALPKRSQDKAVNIMLPIKPIPRAFGTTYATPEAPLGIVGSSAKANIIQSPARAYGAYKNMPLGYQAFKVLKPRTDPFEKYPESDPKSVSNY